MISLVKYISEKLIINRNYSSKIIIHKDDYDNMKHAVAFVYKQFPRTFYIRLIKITSLNNDNKECNLLGTNVATDGTWDLQLTYDKNNQLVTKKQSASDKRYYIYYIIVPLKYFCNYSDDFDTLKDLDECTAEQIDNMFNVNTHDYLEKEFGDNFNDKFKIINYDYTLENIANYIKQHNK